METNQRSLFNQDGTEEDMPLHQTFWVTTNFGKFHNLINRDINKLHVKKIKKEIQENGFSPIHPVVVDEDFNIIDGQHRFMACVELGFPVTYVKVADIKDDKMHRLNTTQLAWNAKDWVKYFARAKNNPNYERLLDLMNSTGYGPTVLISNLNETPANGSDMQRLKQGTLKFSETDKQRVEYLIKKATKVCSYFSHAFPVNSKTVGGLLELSKAKGFDWRTMETKARKYTSKVHACTNKTEYALMFKELYNYNTRADDKRIRSIRCAKYVDLD